MYSAHAILICICLVPNLADSFVSGKIEYIGETKFSGVLIPVANGLSETHAVRFAKRFGLYRRSLFSTTCCLRATSIPFWVNQLCH